jgi:hypothetical protein
MGGSCCGPHLAAVKLTVEMLTSCVLCCTMACCAVQGNGDEEGHEEGGRGRQRPAPELEDTGVTGERAMGKGEH